MTPVSPTPNSGPDRGRKAQGNRHRSTARAALSDLGEATPEQMARQCQQGRAGTVEPLLESLAALNHAGKTETDSYTT